MPKAGNHELSISQASESYDALQEGRRFDPDGIVSEFMAAFGPDTDFSMHQHSAFQLGMHEGLQKSAIRGIYWRLFLGYFENNAFPNKWIELAKKHRQDYADLMKKYAINPHEDDGDVQTNNPLTATADSKWAKYYKNNELCDVIRLDLQRTHQNMPFFVHPETQSRMLNILFVWCKLNPEYGYRQGMNELVAMLLYILSLDASPSSFAPPVSAADVDTSTNSPTLAEPALWCLLDPAFVEHDAFFLFNALMKTMARYYAVVGQSRENSITTSGVSKTTASEAHSRAVTYGGHGAVAAQEPPIVQISNTIFNTLLGLYDKQLHAHLVSVDIVPTLFLLRWIRLIFTREFPLAAVARLWDAVLASGPELELLPYVCISLLVHVRDELLEGDNSVAFNTLLKYPQDVDFERIITQALFLKNNKKPLTFAPPAHPPPTLSNAPSARAPSGTLPRTQPAPATRRQVAPSGGGKGALSFLGSIVNKLGDALVPVPPVYDHRVQQLQPPRTVNSSARGVEGSAPASSAAPLPASGAGMSMSGVRGQGIRAPPQASTPAPARGSTSAVVSQLQTMGRALADMTSVVSDVSDELREMVQHMHRLTKLGAGHKLDVKFVFAEVEGEDASVRKPSARREGMTLALAGGELSEGKALLEGLALGAPLGVSTDEEDDLSAVAERATAEAAEQAAGEAVAQAPAVVAEEVRSAGADKPSMVGAAPSSQGEQLSGEEADASFISVPLEDWLCLQQQLYMIQQTLANLAPTAALPATDPRPTPPTSSIAPGKPTSTPAPAPTMPVSAPIASVVPSLVPAAPLSSTHTAAAVPIFNAPPNSAFLNAASPAGRPTYSSYPARKSTAHADLAFPQTIDLLPSSRPAAATPITFSAPAQPIFFSSSRSAARVPVGEVDEFGNALEEDPTRTLVAVPDSIFGDVDDGDDAADADDGDVAEAEAVDIVTVVSTHDASLAVSAAAPSEQEEQEQKGDEAAPAATPTPAPAPLPVPEGPAAAKLSGLLAEEDVAARRLASAKYKSLFEDDEEDALFGKSKSKNDKFASLFDDE